MTVYETVIKTNMVVGNEPEKLISGILFPVKYAEALLDPGDIHELAFSPPHNALLPYLMVGQFSKDPTQWYFSNARKHEELREALEQDLGPQADFVHAQAMFVLQPGTFSPSPDLIFDKIVLHKDPPSRIEALRNLVNSIDENHLPDRLSIENLPDLRSAEQKWLLHWNKKLEKITP